MVGLFAVVSFMRTFPRLDARELGCASLGEALRDGRVRKALATSGIAYDVANRARPAGPGELLAPAHGRVPARAPPLAFFDRATSAALCDACARQRDAYSEHPDDAVRAALDAALEGPEAAVLSDARGSGPRLGRVPGAACRGLPARAHGAAVLRRGPLLGAVAGRRPPATATRSWPPSSRDACHGGTETRSPRAQTPSRLARHDDVARLLPRGRRSASLQEDVLVPGRAGVADTAVEGELARVGPDVVPEVVVQVVVVDPVRLDDLVPLVRR